MANQTVYFNQFNQLVFANIQYQPIDPEAAFTMRIDPRNYFPPLGEQLAGYKQYPGSLNHWTFYAKQLIDSHGGYFKESHDVEMCKAAEVGIRACSLTCPKIHHYPVYLALGGEPLDKPRPKAPPPMPEKQPTPPIPEMPGLQAISAARSKSEEKYSPATSIHFGPQPLKINEYVEQPIHKLNAETDREERERQIGKRN